MEEFYIMAYTITSQNISLIAVMTLLPFPNISLLSKNTKSSNKSDHDTHCARQNNDNYSTFDKIFIAMANSKKQHKTKRQHTRNSIHIFKILLTSMTLDKNNAYC
jgi:hypothetical protein